MTNNIFNNIGDKIFINSQLGIFGKINIQSISIQKLGENSDRFLQEKFKWSVDNLVWSDWMDLNLINVQQINNRNCDILFLNFWLERSGNDDTGAIELEDIVFDGDIIIKIDDFSTTAESIFKDLISNETFIASISNNLLKKVFEKGILPNYIKRGYGHDNEDFISLWSSVCVFLSYVIGLGNKFDNIFNEKDYLSEYLKQRGIQFEKDEITLSDLQYIANNFNDEVRKRGTKFVYSDKNFKFLDNSSPDVDGEWLRLICKNHYDEFLIEFIKKEHCGYFLDKSSFLYNGTNLSTQLNKTPENTEDFKDLSNFRFINDSSGAYSIENIDNKNALSITPNTNSNVYEQGVFGIGYSQNENPIEIPEKFCYNVDSSIDYEITFKIKKSSTINQAFMKVGVFGLNVNNFVVQNSFKDYIYAMHNNKFCMKEVSSICRTDEWYFLRFIIYAKDTLRLPITASLNDFGITKLIFAEEVNKISPFILFDSEDPNDKIFIHDYKIRPLIRGKNIMKKRSFIWDDTTNGYRAVPEEPYVKNPCFIQNNTSILSWFKNNSTKDDLFVKNFIENYLIPYHKILCEIKLTPKIDDKQLLT